jgi:hypothetical protein
LSLTELTKSRDILARALSIAHVNQRGREKGQAKRLRTVTPLLRTRHSYAIGGLPTACATGTTAPA